MMRLAGAVLSGFGVALLAPWIARFGRGGAGALFALLPLALTLHFAGLLGAIAGGGDVRESYPWVPDLGVALSFRADGWSLLFALLISGVGAIVSLFAGGYLAGHPHRGRFYAYLMAFMASMLGLCLADDLLLLYVFWELTSLTSYFLIGFHHEETESRAAALQALLVTSAGGLCLLAGFLLLGSAGGSFEISTLRGRGEVLRASPLYTPALLLIVIGAATKSAQFPFHFWLPAAMAAPAPVSAYLHSATMVKAGVYLLGRLHPALGGTDLWRSSVTAAGAITTIAGAYLAWQQTDLKKMLAYSTVSSLGTLVMLLGWGSPTAILAAVVYLAAHALYKGALFLLAGSVEHEAGTRDVARLGGLRRAMPLSAASAGMAALSMAGVPVWIGFVAKEAVYGATLGAPLLLGAAVFAGTVHVVVAVLAGAKPFFGLTEPPGQPREVSAGMWIGPAVLGVLGLALGLGVSGAGESLLGPAAAAILGRPARADLSLGHSLSPWHDGEINRVLLLSAATLLAGIGACAAWSRLRRAARPLEAVLRFGPGRWYEGALRWMLIVARMQTRLLQNGYLRSYMLVTLVTSIAAVGAALLRSGELPGAIWEPPIRSYKAVVAGIILLAALVVTRTASRFAAVTALGVIGYGVALLFVMFGAPDLAMTQLATETLSVILFVLVLYRVPRFSALSSAPARARDVVVALSGGVLMTLLVLMVAGPVPSRLTPYFAENSVPLGHGRNVVDVILVDFRALDTLGEITVLTVAAIGGFALLRLRPEVAR